MLAASPDGVRPARASAETPSDFESRLEATEVRLRCLWAAVDAGLPSLGRKTGWRERRQNVRQGRKLIDRLADQIARCPAEGPQRHVWRERVSREILRFGERRLDWPDSYSRLLLSDDFYRTTSDFVRRARAFDPELRATDLAQALRNVWIINSLQLFLGEEPAVTPSAFAYSMLYPYTDNLLDDPEISQDRKIDLTTKVGEWLRGGSPAPSDRLQSKVQRLIATIAEEFDRRQFPAVHSSLQAIHRAQCESLSQQHPRPRQTAPDLLSIGMRKGGTSVLTDGYLVKGTLSEGEESFCLGYGVFLQFLDDLQDVEEDLAAGHRTLFTEAARDGVLDGLTSRLFHFMRAVVTADPGLDALRHAALKDLILRNCTALLLGAIAEGEKYFSRTFLRHVERSSPWGPSAIRLLRRRAVERFRQASETLCRSHGADSVFDLLQL